MPNESRNEVQLLREWSRQAGGDPSGNENELQALRQIAIARGHSSVAGWNETKTLRAIAYTYGPRPTASWNDLKTLRSIVVAVGGVPANRRIGNMNEIDCLRAIVGGGHPECSVIAGSFPFTFPVGSEGKYYRAKYVWDNGVNPPLVFWGDAVGPIVESAPDITTGLVHNYEFDESSGTVADDDQPANNFLGTVVGTVTWGAGHIGNAVIFDGAAGMDSDGVGPTPGSNPFTFSFWLETASLPTNMCVFSAGTNEASGYFFYIITDGQALFATSQSGASQTTSTAVGAVAASGFKHIAITRSGAAVKIYVNGVDVTVTAGTHIDPAAHGTALQVGRYGAGGFWFVNGKMDRMKYYSRALAGADIAALAAQ